MQGETSDKSLREPFAITEAQSSLSQWQDYYSLLKLKYFRSVCRDYYTRYMVIHLMAGERGCVNVDSKVLFPAKRSLHCSNGYINLELRAS